MATTMSKYQCSHVESHALSTALQASWLPSNFQIDIVAISSSHMSLNNGKFYVTQGHKNIYALMNFSKSDDITDKHIRDAIGAHKLEAIYGGTILENNLPIIEKCITPSWVSHTWKFMWEKNIMFQ